ncbi:hypothetical protein NQ317_009226 [Molorchus minor]|uniref:Uncharacterized protein n=1 Tax=Molorchus minor TaxID=1323400 RepID=A0ABQ9IWD8_9CUCU|nr:hypothetical protein NQ317_009226 [Molorchus minor]
MDVKKIAAAIIVYKVLKRKKEQKVKRSCWVKPWIKRRAELGVCFTLTRELEIEDAQQFRNFVRMNAVQVQHIIELVGPKIVKKNTKMREAISVYERVMVTLRFLATGDSYSSLQYLFRIPVCTIGRIVKEVAPAIYDALKDKYMKVKDFFTN